jgi:hypothetical protein
LLEVARVDPVLVLDEPAVEVEPGGEVRVRLTVSGGGTEVERYRLEVLGDTSRWAQVEPRHVSVPPGAEQVVEVVFRPPHAAAAAYREIPFGVRALSLEHRERAAVVEGDLVVAPVRDVEARIEPAAAAGRWGAGYRVQLDNRGPAPVTLRISGSDPARMLRFAVSPAAPEVPAGGSVTALVSVKVRGPRLVGRPQRHAFGVDYRDEGAASAGRLPATFDQRPVLPTAVAALLGIVALALVAGAVLLALQLTGPGPARPDDLAGPGPAAPADPGSGTPGVDPVQGFVVIYGPPTPVDDTVNQQVAEAFAAELVAAGVAARVVDSRDSEQLDDGLKGLLVVLQDGFPDRAAATAECTARRAVAPACVVVAPR